MNKKTEIIGIRVSKGIKAKCQLVAEKRFSGNVSVFILTAIKQYFNRLKKGVGS